MVHEVNGGIWRIAGRRHEERRRSTKGNDGVEGSEGEGEDGRGVVACEGRDGARRRKLVAGSEVRADSS